MPTHDLLSLREVAQISGLREQTIRAYLRKGRIPQPDIRLGGRPGWRRETVERWLTAREVIARRRSME